MRGLLRRAWCDVAGDVARCSGRYGLLLAPFADAAFALPAPNLHTCIRLQRDGTRWRGELACDEVALPLADGCLALAFLGCALETAGDPTGLAAECARVLEPEGTLLVLGLNPLSPARLRWMFTGLRAWSPDATATMLSGLGMDVLGWRYLGARWSGAVDSARIDVAGVRMHGSPLRSAYLLEARRRDPGLTPLRLSPTRIPIGGGAPAGSARVRSARIRSSAARPIR